MDLKEMSKKSLEVLQKEVQKTLEDKKDDYVLKIERANSHQTDEGLIINLSIFYNVGHKKYIVVDINISKSFPKISIKGDKNFKNIETWRVNGGLIDKSILHVDMFDFELIGNSNKNSDDFFLNVDYNFEKEKEKEKEKNNDYVLKLTLSTSKELLVIGYYIKNEWCPLGFINTNGYCYILTTSERIKNYEIWREHGMEIDENVINWNNGKYQLIYTVLEEVMLRRKDILTNIYDFEDCGTSISCEDPNIQKFKHNNKPYNF